MRLDNPSRIGGPPKWYIPETEDLIISALGIDIFDKLDIGLVDKMIELIEKNCLCNIAYFKPDGKKVKVKGVDFVDHDTATELGREGLISPEWTFQLINAYRRLELYYRKFGDVKKETW